MKKVSLFILGLLMVLLPMNVFAASASISVSASNTVMLNNQVTVTVKLSSGSNIGAWEMNLNYDKRYLQLVSSTAEGNGTYMVSYATNGKGIKSKSYTFKFKTLKKGSTKVSINSSSITAYDESPMTTSNGSTTINIKTKEEIEATYSSNANLKSLRVGDYPLTPAFNKKTLEYNVEVENEVASVNISASKEDGEASISGAGEKELVEGNNKFEIVVTAQKGNTQTYVINVYRKELDPIHVDVDGQDLTIVRKATELPEYNTFAPITIKYNEDEIPALKSEITGYTIIGLKDEDGNISMYIYDDDKITDKYIEVKTNSMSIYPLELPDNDLFQSYIKKNIDIDDSNVEAYLMNEDSKYAIIYAQDIETGDTNYYSYSIKDHTVQIFNKDLIEAYETKITNYKYVLLGLIALIIILLFILIMKSPSKNKRKKVKKEEALVKTIENHIDEEIKEEVKEVDEIHLVEEKEDISNEEDKSEFQDNLVSEHKLSKKEKKRLLKEEKRNAKRKSDFDI